MPDARPDSSTPEKQPHWYFITVEECAICAYTYETRERRYTPRPEHWGDRHEYIRYACGEHFV